jgi:hypothetical protein
MNPVNQELNAGVCQRGWIDSVLNSIRFMRRNTLCYCALRGLSRLAGLLLMVKGRTSVGVSCVAGALLFLLSGGVYATCYVHVMGYFSSRSAASTACTTSQYAWLGCAYYPAGSMTDCSGVTNSLPVYWSRYVWNPPP